MTTRCAHPFTSRFPTRIHRLQIAGQTIDLLAPVDPDALLDDPIVEQRYKADNYLPYWPIIWPSGLMMAERILRGEESPPAPPLPLPMVAAEASLRAMNMPSAPPQAPAPLGMAPRCIDLGCGLGGTGIAAGKRGWHVTFTDYDPEAVEFAAHNALRNGVPAERVRAIHMDWREPIGETFRWVLASDVLYERRLHALVLGAIGALLAEGGEAWVSDPQRTAAEDFPLAAVEAGFKVATVNMKGQSFSGGVQEGTLYVLTRGYRE